jgi:hypothetical protein
MSRKYRRLQAESMAAAAAAAAVPERIWYQSPATLFADERYLNFVPVPHTTLAEQLNASLRFALYFGVILIVMQHSVIGLYVPLVTAAVTYVMYTADHYVDAQRAAKMEALDVQRDPIRRRLCTRPTLDNPFMNVLVSDYARFPERPEPCDITRPAVVNKAESYFAVDLYKDGDDIFDRNANSRQFYTVPGSTIPNDQGTFADWLYNPGPTCKTGNGGRCAQLIYRPLAA